MIYLDNAATTPVAKEAVEAMSRVYGEDFFNPSSTYAGGMRAASLISEARATVAKALGCTPRELYFTSCATEADNWALTSGFKNKKGNIVVSRGEHACVYECAAHLKAIGLDVRFAGLDPSGTVNESELLALTDENTCLVSVIHVSNETGAVNDIGALAGAVKKKNPRTLFHSDGVQAFLKTGGRPIPPGVDLYAISGHKVGAPKGIGALYISSKVRLAPMIYGGGQESGLRSGTENVSGIVGLGAAVRAYSAAFDRERALKLRSRLLSLLPEIGGARAVCEGAQSTGMITAITLDGVRAETVQSMCSDRGLIIGRGSACSSRHGGNRVLSAIGLSAREIEGAIRLSFSPTTTEEEIDEAVRILGEVTKKLRGGRVG